MLSVFHPVLWLLTMLSSPAIGSSCVFEYLQQPPSTPLHGCDPYTDHNTINIAIECMVRKKASSTASYEIRWFRENTHGVVEDLGAGNPETGDEHMRRSRYDDVKLLHQNYHTSLVGKYWCQVINTTADPDQPLMRSNAFTLLPPENYTGATCYGYIVVQVIENTTCADTTRPQGAHGTRERPTDTRPATTSSTSHRQSTLSTATPSEIQTHTHSTTVQYPMATSVTHPPPFTSTELHKPSTPNSHNIIHPVPTVTQSNSRPTDTQQFTVPTIVLMTTVLITTALSTACITIVTAMTCRACFKKHALQRTEPKQGDITNSITQKENTSTSDTQITTSYVINRDSNTDNNTDGNTEEEEPYYCHLQQISSGNLLSAPPTFIMLSGSLQRSEQSTLTLESSGSRTEQTTLERSTMDQPTYEQSIYKQPTIPLSTFEQTKLQQTALERPTTQQTTLKPPIYERLTIQKPTPKQTSKEPVYQGLISIDYANVYDCITPPPSSPKLPGVDSTHYYSNQHLTHVTSH